MSDTSDFLRFRGIPEDVISPLEEQKVSENTSAFVRCINKEKAADMKDVRPQGPLENIKKMLISDILEGSVALLWYATTVASHNEVGPLLVSVVLTFFSEF